MNFKTLMHIYPEAVTANGSIYQKWDEPIGVEKKGFLYVILTLLLSVLCFL